MIDFVCSGDTCTCSEWRQSSSHCALLSCDGAKSLGTDGGPCLSISVTVVFFPVDQSHMAAQRTDIAWTSLSQACSPHFRTHERLIRGPQRQCFTAAWTLDLVVIWTNVFRSKEDHTCSLYPCIHTFHCLPPSLCVVANWWVQLEFHTQLGSNSNGDWHVPVNPLRTTATLDVYILDLYCVNLGEWWQVMKKNAYEMIYALLIAGLRLVAWIIRYKDLQLLC